MGGEPASVRVSVCKHFQTCISPQPKRPITTKFYLKQHLAEGKAASGFCPDQIRTLVSMATDSSHRVIMGKIL